MRTFKLALRDNDHYREIDGVVSFVGEDASGSFGILSGHAPLLTSLVFGLARFRAADGPWQYVAVPGAILRFAGNVLALNTRRFLVGSDYNAMSRELVETLAREERSLAEMKRTLRDIESQVLRRLLEMNKAGFPAGPAGWYG